MSILFVWRINLLMPGRCYAGHLPGPLAETQRFSSTAARMTVPSHGALVLRFTG